MDEAAITQYLTNTFEGVESVIASGDFFFFSGSDHKMPFLTIVTSDAYDAFSNLNRPSVFRLNIGVSRPTYRGIFDSEAGEGSYDFTALDQLMPHPVYGKMFWVCVLNPSDATFERLKPLLAEAYLRSVKPAKFDDVF